MAKKIIVLCGSPNAKGATNTLVEWAAEAARAKGAEVEVVDLLKLEYKVPGCTGCFGCQKSEEYRCVIDDEAADMLARLPEADVIVSATPVYFFGPTAQFKRFQDRMFSLFKMQPEGGFKSAIGDCDTALIATAGGSMEYGLGLTVQVFEMATSVAGQSLKTLLAPEVDLDDPELKAKATAFGELLAG